jgi:hypothetical protein
LLCILNPRTIPEVLHLFEKIKGYDKLWLKNMNQVMAYHQLRLWFLEHTEYTHLIILLDDVLITQEEFDILRLDVEEGDYPVIGGIGNVSYLRLEEYSPCIDVMPSYDEYTYKFMKKSELEAFVRAKEFIKQVKFEGFSLTFIRRDIVEQVPFRGDNSIDLNFAIDCEAKGIPTYVDFRTKMFHLKWRMGKGVYENINVGGHYGCLNPGVAQIIFEPYV